MQENFVIAISAVPGGGKTTLVKKTAGLLEATTLFFDDYASVSEYPKDIIQWMNDGADLNEWKTPVFAKDVAALKRGERIIHPVANDTIESNEFIVIEDPIGRGRNEMTELIDFMVLIDTPLDIALARRLLRNIEKYYRCKAEERLEKATKEELIEYPIESVSKELNRYLSEYRAIYLAFQEQMSSYCDLILDGGLPSDELANQLVAAAMEKRK
ncbi:hypothetical protein IH992_10420 [Candidatus Poribacteria bacterium]|nr:hypothetical protein [Candidatus Poribacteria bacterium]